MKRCAILLASFLFLAGLDVPAQTKPQTINPTASDAAPQTGATIRLTTHEVLLDLVVRDKRERLVSDLKAGDVEVYEDGVKQTPKSFQLVTGREQTSADERAKVAQEVTAKPAAGLNALREINLVSIVFTRMSPRSRDFAREAVVAFLKNQLLSNTLAAVYSLDYKLNALQVYTNSLAALTRAADHAAQGVYSQYATDNENVLNQLEVVVANNGGSINVYTGFNPAQSAQMALTTADSTMGEGALFQAKVISDQRFLGAADEGIRTLESLRAFVRSQASLPGRKTVILLGEGLPVPPERPEMLQSLIGDANGANVSFYAIDVRGLSTKSSTGQATSELLSRAGKTGDSRTIASTTATADTSIPGADGVNPNTVFTPVPGASGGADMHIDDSLLLAVHADTQQSMRELADSTGGFLVANTNQIEQPMRRVMEDVREHYEIAYSPTSSNLDGHFRKIEVRLKRPGLKLQTRKGYFALPDTGGEPIRPFEEAALKVINAAKPPSAVAYSAGLLDFGPVGNRVLCVATFQVPQSGLTVTEDPEKKTVRLHASVLGLMKDQKGQIAGKVSRDLNIEVPSEQAEKLRQGDLIYTQWVELPPGLYTLESAVLDTEGSKSGVKRATFEVPKPEQLTLSSISLVRRVERASADRDPLNPLEYRGGKVVPALAGTAKHGTDTSFYFVLYPASTSDGKVDLSVKPSVTVQFYLDGKLIADAVPPLTWNETARAIPVFLAARFEPGQYMVKVLVEQGTFEAERSAAFVVE
jgi:VWFA-related protein